MSVWSGRVMLVLLLAVGVNSSLALLGVPHDAPLLTLLAVLAVAGTAATLDLLDRSGRVSWRGPAPGAAAYPGEDGRTARFRHAVEAHLSAHEPDDAVLRLVGDLARTRLRQRHGIGLAEDPVRADELLGPTVTTWMALDEQPRSAAGPGARRYSLAELARAVDRVERL